MDYRQNDIPRDCALCGRPILPDEHMLDLFRAESSKPDPVTRLLWAHTRCCVRAVENWIAKRRFGQQQLPI